jgi:hypothetical protein
MLKKVLLAIFLTLQFAAVAGTRIPLPGCYPCPEVR